MPVFSRLSLIGLALMAGCGTPAPASIQAPARIVVSDTTLQTVDAKALDASGAVLEGVQVAITTVSDPNIVRMGNNGELQCKSFGTATATLEAAPVKHDLVISCMLIREIRPEPATLNLVLTRDDAGKFGTTKGGPFGFTVIGLDGAPVTGADVAITAADPSLITIDAAGMVEGLRRGRTTIKAVVGDKIGTVEVVIGEQVAQRKGMVVEDSDKLGMPLDAGTYRITAGSSEPIELSANGGSCAEHETAGVLDVVCTLEKTGTIVVENPGTLGMGSDAQINLRVVRLP